MLLESGEQFDHFAIQDTKDSYIIGFWFNWKILSSPEVQ